MIEIPEELYRRVCNLLQCLTNTCKECTRPKILCENCDLSPAPYLLSRMRDAVSGTANVDYGRRFDIIESEIRSKGRPVLAREIDPHKKLCGRGLKYWSLRKMVKLGMIVSFKRDNQIYFTTKD